MRAVVVRGNGVEVDNNKKVPALRDDYIAVRPLAVALNPTDWKSVSYGRAIDGCVVGCDYAGIVEEVGQAVTKSWRKGDKIFGCAHGANLLEPEDGVFAQHAVAKGDLQMRLPPGLSFEEAATLPLGLITIGQGLYQKGLGLNLPTVPVTDNQSVLIYGGSTATGALAIQFAKLSGYQVITVCPKADFQYVRSLGADAMFDYSKPQVGLDIRAYTDDALQYSFDTISIESSAKICGDALSSRLHGRYGSTLPVRCPRDDVDSVSIVMYTVFGENFTFGEKSFTPSIDDYEFGKMFYHLAEALIEKGQIRPHRMSIEAGGLDGVVEGLRQLQKGEKKGRKLVYRVSTTDLE